MGIQKLLILTVCIGNFALKLAQMPHKTSISKINDDSKVRKNFQNLFNSIAKDNTKKSGIYHDMLKAEADREQKDFDSIKEELWTARNRNALKKRNFYVNTNTDEKVVVTKRLVVCVDDEETASTPSNNGTDGTARNQTKKEKQEGPYRFLHIEDNRIHMAGILGLRAANVLARGGVEAETETIFRNMKNLLEGYDDSSLEKVIWIKFLLVNMSESSVIEDKFHKYFKPPYPNKTIIPIEKLKFGARVEAELFASLNYSKKMDVELY